MKKVLAQITKVELVYHSPLAPHIRLTVEDKEGQIVAFDVRHFNHQFVEVENGQRTDIE